VSGEIPRAIGDLPAGTRIASYQIEELIGRGGMAVVYRAIDVRLDRPVALKILAPELAADEAFRQRFIRESRAAAAVDHPNVIPVFEAGEADGMLFIAMRYVSGQDVRALIERSGRLPVARTVSIVAQVAAALDAAHAHGLVHRDVKPANMLLAAAGDGTTPDHVYLSDFGLSKHAVSTASLTGTGQFLGTLDYMSPEQVEGRPIDGRTDLYALACAAFEMLTGEPPFRREENLAVLWAQVSMPPPSVRQRRPELSAEVDQVMATALAKSPADRQASCTEFAAALRAACAVRPAGRSDAPRHPPVAAPPDPTELALRPGQAAAVAPEVTITELPADGGARGTGAPVSPGGTRPVGPGRDAAARYQPRSGLPASGPAPGYQPTTGLPAAGPAPGYQPTTGLPAAGPAPGFQPRTGSPAGQPSGQQPTAGFPAAGPAPGFQPRTGFPAAPGQQAAGWRSGPPGLTDRLLTDTPGYPPHGPRRRRGKGLPILLGLLVVLALAAVALVVLHVPKGLFGAQGHPSPAGTKTVTVSPTPRNSASVSPSGGPSSQSPPPVASPGTVVTDYYNAINNHDYRTAWRLNAGAHAVESFAAFKAGFAGTQFDTLTVVGVSGDVVTIKLAAQQTDGTVKNFQGTYTVQNGTIVGSSIQQV